MCALRLPYGDTTASRLKALVLFLDAKKSAKESDRFLAEIGLPREALNDETQSISVAIWQKGVEHFVHTYGEAAMFEASKFVIHPQNLGPWISVVRQAGSPESAFRMLETLESGVQSSQQIETISSSHHRWRGRVRISHDSSLEAGGYLSLARRAEFMAVPMLFGFRNIGVQEIESLERGSDCYVYDVCWQQPRARFFELISAALLSMPLLFFLPSPWVAVVGGAIVALVAGSLLSLWITNERHRQVVQNAQLVRIQALERNLELTESAPPSSVGNIEGALVAGLYRLKKRLGSGATGVIHEAERVSDKALVAVKLLRAAVAQDTVASDRLTREAEALRLTWHPNVVELYDYGHLADGTTFVVLERMFGETLSARLAREGVLSQTELVSIVLQICDALAAVHAAGVVHRDLKPSNVFLCRDTGGGNGLKVKLFDFGIAKVEWAETRITNMGTPLGTAGYMAPEQENGEEVDHLADIYSLGALMLECLTGRPPPVRVSHSRRSEPPTPAMLPAPALDPQWAQLIETSMALRPSERFQDARSIAAALEAMAFVSGTISKSDPIDKESAR